MTFVAVVYSGGSLLVGMARKRGTKNTGFWRAMVISAGVNDAGVSVVDETSV